MKYRLKEICVEITNKCPSRCIHCSSLAGEALLNELTTQEIKNILNTFYEMSSFSLKTDKQISLEEALYFFSTGNLQKKEDGQEWNKFLQSELFKLRSQRQDKPALAISGGEPLCRPDIYEIVKYAKEKGFKVLFYTSALAEKDNTFCVGLTDEFIGKIQKIFDKEDSIILSVEGATAETHEKITKIKGHFEILEDAALRLKKHKTFKVEMHCTPMKLNFREVPDLIELAKDWSVDNISFLRLVPQGRALNNKEKLMLDKKEFKELLIMLHREWLKTEEEPTSKPKVRLGCPIDFRHLMFPVKRKPCHGGKDQLLIRPDGEIHPCPAWKDIEGMSLGNLKDDRQDKITIQSAWLNSDVMGLFRKYCSNNLWGDCFYCPHGIDICAGGCPAQRILANQDRGIRNKEALLRIGPDPLCFRNHL